MERTLEDELQDHKYAVVNTVGVSMRPLLRQGKTHVVVARPTGELKPGDLPIYYRGDSQQVLHRILRVGDNCYYIRGDNCVVTEVVPKSSIIGVVTKIYRNGNYIQMDDVWYQRYIAIWNFIFPLRYLWYRLRGVLSSIKHRLCRMERV